MNHCTKEYLLSLIQEASKVIKVGDIWTHTKTNHQYQILGIGISEETLDVEVEYKEVSQEPPIIWHRSFNGKNGWLTPTTINNQSIPRFVKNMS